MAWQFGPFYQNPDVPVRWTLTWGVNPGVQVVQAMVDSFGCSIEYTDPGNFLIEYNVWPRYQITITTRNPNNRLPVSFFFTGTQI